jgi:diguanylate cyclase (GGDEF)-like protein
MQVVQISLVKAVIESLPAPASIISPRENKSGSVVDLDISLANDRMRELIADASKMSVVLDDERLSALIRDLETARESAAIVTTRLQMLRAESQLALEYHLESRWHGDHVIAIATSVRPLLPTAQSVAYSADIIVKAMPEMPIAYGVLVDGHWQRFPTQAMLSALNLSPAEFDELSLMDLPRGDERARVEQWLHSVEHDRGLPLTFLASAKPSAELSETRWMTVRMSHVSSNENPLHASSADESNGGGTGGGGDANFFVLRDVDDEVRLREQSQDALRHLDEQLGVLSSALNASRDGFAIWKAVRDKEGDIDTFELVFINDAGAAPTGKMARKLLGRQIETVVGGTEAKDLSALFSRALKTHQVQTETVQINSSAGWVGAYQNQVVPFSHDQVLTSFRDISEDQRERDRLNWLAEHDHLTGLPNRRNLEEILQAALDRVRGTSQFIAFAFVDIDDFKKVNDTHGHDIGDSLLKEFGQRMRLSLGEAGVVARLAGDEFGLVIDSVPSDAELKRTLAAMLEHMREPFASTTTPLSVSCSAGVALCAGAEPISEVLRIADKAMYRAKHDGKNRFHVVHI